MFFFFSFLVWKENRQIGVVSCVMRNGKKKNMGKATFGVRWQIPMGKKKKKGEKKAKETHSK
jgi:hypothetical protein